MRSINRVLPFLILLLSYPVICLAQTPARDKSASISGRVTIGGKGAAGITVVAAVNRSAFDVKTVAKTTTDDDGNYRLRGLTAGHFAILPVAKAFVADGGGPYIPPEQRVNVAEGESITKIDFALVRGGVITGRIADAEGNPLIGERVNVVLKDPLNTTRRPITPFVEGLRNQTDDRGIYRIYGLGPGNYTVSVGQETSGGSGNFMGMGGSKHVQTFYPGVQEESKATIVEVKEGAEVTGIDITPGKSAEGFSVSGRAIDAESGQPVASVFIGYSSNTDANQGTSETNFGGRTDANGNFRLEGLQPGRYAAFTIGFEENNNSYSDRAPFDISDGNVTGIEIKVRRGGILDGAAVVENSTDPAASALLQKVQLYAAVTATAATSPSYSRGQINPDGTFHLVGLAPGKVWLGIQPFPAPPKGLTLMRTELNGLDQREGIELAAGAHVSGVRLVFAYGTETIRGEVKIEGGVLPEGTTLQLSLRSRDGVEFGGESPRFNPIEVDARGQFVSENIPPGAYELSLRGIPKDHRQAPAFEPVNRTVTVANGADARVVFIVNLAAKGPQ